MLHIALIVLLLLWSVHPQLPNVPRAVTHIFAPLPDRAPSRGGGMREPEPVRKGVLPPASPRVFTPPMIHRVDYTPRLMMPPAVDAPPDLPMKTGEFGDPHGLGTMSAGMGGPLGIGDGIGASVGRGDGADGVYGTGHGVSAPVPIHTVEPEYSESARKAHISGSVLVYAEIDPQGHPRNLRVVQSLGMGLDEKALEAVAKWLFKPGMKNGKPATVRATFEVNFRLL
jgi:protein TonB